MCTFINILLIILAIIIIGGIIRSIRSTTTGFWDTIIEILWLDTLFDVLGSILENIDFD
jgi:hypothetical protein